METMTGRVAAVLWLVATSFIGSPHTFQYARASVPPSFDAAIRGYTQLRQAVEDRLPPLVVTSDPAVIEAGVHARHVAIRAARAGARPGDIFTPETANAFRTLIATMLADRGLPPDDLVEEEPDEMPAIRPTLAVHGRFSWAFANAMAPCLLDVLPRLPAFLQYRLVDRDLVLLDVDANLVIDILRDALPAAASHTTE